MGLGGAGAKNFSVWICDGAPSTEHSNLFFEVGGEGVVMVNVLPLVTSDMTI